jgi:tryptophan synthase alpha chain
MSVSRLDACFQRLREQQRKALIPFVTAGDPSLEATVPVMHALVEAGADVIELGVPFSDPMADGPTIQRSSERALARGAGSRYVLQAVAQFRERDAQTPVVLMGYLNPVEIHGYAAFAKAAVDAGVDGVLLVDLPPEEAGEAQQAFDAAGLALVLLARRPPARRVPTSCWRWPVAISITSALPVSPARPSAWTAMPPVPACRRCARARRCRWWRASASRMPPVPRPWPARPTAWWWAARWWRRWPKRLGGRGRAAPGPSSPRCGRRWTRNGVAPWPASS